MIELFVVFGVLFSDLSINIIGHLLPIAKTGLSFNDQGSLRYKRGSRSFLKKRSSENTHRIPKL